MRSHTHVRSLLLLLLLSVPTGDCYMGSSAGALAEVAREFGYHIVDVEPGLDLFLVDGRRWGGRPVPTLSTAAIFRPFNIRRNRTGLAYTHRARALLEYRTWRREGDVAAARGAARRALAELATQPGLPCFGPESGHRCSDGALVLCRELWAVLCPPPAEKPSSYFANPCHGTRDLWHMGAGMTLLASRRGMVARRFLARDLNVKTAF